MKMLGNVYSFKSKPMCSLLNFYFLFFFIIVRKTQIPGNEGAFEFCVVGVLPTYII